MAQHRIVTVTLNPALDHILEAGGLEAGRHVRAVRLGRSPGGKGINVARMLGAMGTGCVATGFIGRGELGMFEEFLERATEGRAVMQLLVVRGRTRDNITIMDPVLDAETHIRTEGITVQREDARRIVSKVAMLARPETVVCLCGSVPPGVLAGDLRTMAHLAVEGGAKLVVDMAGASLRALLGERMWMLKVNDGELAEALGRPIQGDEEAVEAARGLLVNFGGPAEVVIVTRGAAGAVCVSPEGAFVARTFVHPGRIATTVGCGDALLAGVLHAWSRREGWAETLRWGVGTASAHATSREPGVLDTEAVAELVEATTVEPLTLGVA